MLEAPDNGVCMPLTTNTDNDDGASPQPPAITRLRTHGYGRNRERGQDGSKSGVASRSKEALPMT